jgi:hypothetical protein
LHTPRVEGGSRGSGGLAAGGATRGRRREQAEEGADGVTIVMGEELGGVLRDGGAWSAWSGREPASDDGLGRCRAPCSDTDPGQGRRDDAPWGAGEPRGLGSAARSRAMLRWPARRTVGTTEKVGRRPCGLGRRRAVWVSEEVGRWPGMVAAPGERMSLLGTAVRKQGPSSSLAGGRRRQRLWGVEKRGERNLALVPS